ncbi:MAG: DNA-3-methyladenine glycosylase [Actinobacteria bacterium]|nr:DNA-3-methyladenine glycosylase [Actinomycetota bacterium]
MSRLPERLGRSFFARPAPEVAADLVGALLVRVDERLVARLSEAEAYMRHDPACHAHRGRTRRNEPLWGPAGHAYVYFSYGMHWCLNVSTGTPGDPQGCLLRAAEPLRGVERMRARRGDRADRELLRGPARLAQAFGLDGSWSGRDLCAPGGRLYLAAGGLCTGVVAGPRVGVAVGADTPWRFTAARSPWVSSYRRSPRAGPPGGTG